jgi:hypothetical protein
MIPKDELNADRVGLFVQQCFTTMSSHMSVINDKKFTENVRLKCVDIADATDDFMDAKVKSIDGLLVLFDSLMSCVLNLQPKGTIKLETPHPKQSHNEPPTFTRAVSSSGYIRRQ